MSITSQLPPISLAQASASLRALAQAAGQTVEARVLSQGANGTTQVQIGRQVLSLTLPQAQAVGTTLTLSVQQSDGQLRLALVDVRPPGAAPGGMPPTSAPPATSVQLSPAALASPAMSSITPASVPVQGGAPHSAASLTAAQVGSGAPAATGAAGPSVSPAAGYGPVIVPGAAAVTPPMPAASGGVSVALPDGPGSPAPASTAAAPAATQRLPVQGGALPPGPGGPVSAAGGAPAAAATASSQPDAPQSVVPANAATGAVAAHPAPGIAGRATIPYAVATPTTVPAPPAATAGSAATALPPVTQAVSSSLVGQHAPPPNMPGAPAPPAAQSAAPGAPQPTSPQAALAQMVQQALPRQDSILGLTTALTAIAGKVALPEPVAKAAQQVLASRLSLDGMKLGGAAIKAAIQQSGVFQEAMLASGQAPGGELKGALLALRQGLGAWLGNQAPVTHVGGVAPPIRGQVPRARAGEGRLVDLPEDPAEMGKLLFERTEAALSRLRLHQNASLPDPNPMRQDAQWSMDLPVIVAGQNQVLQMQIQRDAEQEAERSEERGWQVRFAINLAERGEVGAQISLRAKNTSVLLWADQAATAQSLGMAVEELRAELAEVGLVPGAIVVRAGAPADQPIQPAGREGHMVDATR